jgi:hypothetical protein
VAYQFSNLDESTSDMVRALVSFRKNSTKVGSLQRYENHQSFSYRYGFLIRTEIKWMVEEGFVLEEKRRGKAKVDKANKRG